MPSLSGALTLAAVADSDEALFQREGRRRGGGVMRAK